MVVLDHGFLSVFNCGQRTGAIFAGALLIQAAIVISRELSLRRGGSGYDRYEIELLEPTPLFSRRRLIVYGVWCAVFMLVASVCAFWRVRTALFMDENRIIEVSCIGPFSDEYSLDRAKIDVAFVNEGPGILARRNTHDEIYLKIAEPGKPRPLTIDLYRRGDDQPLLDLAPNAMRDYDDYRRSHRGS